jgi:uncharacterized protein (TIGR04222 family)
LTVQQNDANRRATEGGDLANKALLEAIYCLNLSDETEPDAFAWRLAALNCWTAGRSARVVQEYRRFIYLSQVSTSPVSPSDAVDQAWHLHLLQTRNYWDGLCRDVLGKALHHTPSTGDPEPLQSDLNQYAATLVLYEKTFSEKPPIDIWPDPSVRFSCANDRVSISAAKLPMTNRNWIAHSTAFGAVCVVIACTLTGSLFNTLPILALSGAVFFGAFLLVLIVALFIGESSGWISKPVDLDSYEAAWLAGDTAHVGATAVATLLHLGLVRFEVKATGENGAATCALIDGVAKPHVSLHPCERAALKAIAVGPIAAATFYHNGSLLAVTRRMRERLGRSGLAWPRGYVEPMPVYVSCVLAVIMTVGVYRSTLDDPLAGRLIVASCAFLLLWAIIWALELFPSGQRVSSKGAAALKLHRSQIINKYSRLMSAGDFSKAFALQGSEFVMNDRRFYGINYFVGTGPPSNTGNTEDAVGCGNNAPRCGA